MFLKRSEQCLRQSKWPKKSDEEESAIAMLNYFCEFFNVFQFQIKWIGILYSFVIHFCWNLVSTFLLFLNYTPTQIRTHIYKRIIAGESNIWILLMATVILLPCKCSNVVVCAFDKNHFIEWNFFSLFYVNGAYERERYCHHFLFQTSRKSPLEIESWYFPLNLSQKEINIVV